MSSTVVSDLVSSSLSAAEVISRMGDADYSPEQRRATMSKAMLDVEAEYATRSSDLARRKREMHETKYKYENLSELADSMMQLRESLEENRRQVKQSEHSLASTGSVLEYDSAKTRSNKLIQIITARLQYERARESLKDVDGEDPSRRLAYIVDLHSAHETLQKYLSAPAVNNELEELKDRFLAWQSAALAIAIQQADYNKLMDIQKIYESLARGEQFTGIFRRVCANRLKELDVRGVDSIHGLFAALYREIEYILDHYLNVIRRFNSEQDSIALIKDAVSEGLENLDMSPVLSSLIGQSEDPLELTNSIRKTFADCKEKLAKNPNHAKFADIIVVLKRKTVDTMVGPFKSAFTNIALAKINGLELKGASHRQHVENLNLSTSEVAQLLDDIISHSVQLFGSETAGGVYRQAVERSIDNLASKLKSWEYWKSSSGKERSVEELFLVCAAFGHLMHAMQRIKETVEATNPSIKPNLKALLRFNSGCCDRILKGAAESIIDKMAPAINSVKSEKVDDSHTKSLPLFSISPHEYITNAGQDLLHLFHSLEQFFLDENVLSAFHIALKKKIEGDEILKHVVADVSEKVVVEFVEAIGDVSTLEHAHAKQFLVDTVFLKDALFDLRCERLDQLVDMEARLRQFVEGSK